jgi:energy-coupling factor transporter ATP-binding protein EcfA2
MRELPPVQWLHESFDVKEVSYLVRGLIEPGSFVVLYGEAGCGKSTIAVDLAFAVSQGSPWRDRPTKRGMVLHIAGEGARGLRLRQAAYIEHYAVPRTAPYALLPMAVPFGPATESELIELVARAATNIGEPPALVIVDTLARCLTGDENTASDMGRFIGCCDAIRNTTGASLMVLHHAGKDSTKGARGHSSLRAAADTELEVIGRANPRSLIVRKQRDLELSPPMTFDLGPVQVGELDGSPVTACVVKHTNDAPAPARPSGRQQAGLLAELERRFARGAVAWTDHDLRAIGRELNMHKNTARSAVLGLFAAQYLVPSVGGATLKYPPERRP